MSIEMFFTRWKKKTKNNSDIQMIQIKKKVSRWRLKATCMLSLLINTLIDNYQWLLCSLLLALKWPINWY